MKFKTRAKVAGVGGVVVLAMASKGGAFGAAGHAAAHAAHLAHLAHASQGAQGAQAITVATGPVPSGPLNSSVLTADQNAFANQLAAKTGLNVFVVGGELLAEESGGNAQQRQAQGNEDWGNVGYTDSGFVGTGDSIWWSGPVVAANATAAWMAGTYSVPGFGNAAASVRHILAYAHSSVAAQIGAYQASGWASGGYGGLATDVQEVENGQR